MLLEKISLTDVDVKQLFVDDRQMALKSPLDKDKRKQDKLLLEESYLTVRLQSYNVLWSVTVLGSYQTYISCMKPEYSPLIAHVQ